jgi:uncharacterized protein YecE (DUF72 family)
MALYTGTSGYAYKEWKGSFYPADLKDDAMLGHYASRLPAVEINNTFYRMPKESVVLGWADQVPESFRFVLKATRRITHFGRLKGVESELEYFLRVSQALGARRGPSLFKLPPNMKQDLERLTAFLALLPNQWRAAFEFRHRSWFDDEVFAALRARNAALCIADQAEDEDATPFVATADWGYLRLRREAYTRADLEGWAGWIREQGWEDCYAFFKHEDGATGPALAADLLGLGVGGDVGGDVSG